MLTPIDHLLASQLGLGHFVRYCDDLVIFAHDRNRLQHAWEAIHQRCDSLRLRLHPTKCRLHRTTEPVAFLGFVLEHRWDTTRIRLQAANPRRFRRRMTESNALLRAGAITIQEHRSRLLAWQAHAAHGNNRGLVDRELRRLGCLYPEPQQ